MPDQERCETPEPPTIAALVELYYADAADHTLNQQMCIRDAAAIDTIAAKMNAEAAGGAGGAGGAEAEAAGGAAEARIILANNQMLTCMHQCWWHDVCPKGMTKEKWQNEHQSMKERFREETDKMFMQQLPHSLADIVHLYYEKAPCSHEAEQNLATAREIDRLRREEEAAAWRILRPNLTLVRLNKAWDTITSAWPDAALKDEWNRAREDIVKLLNLLASPPGSNFTRIVDDHVISYENPTVKRELLLAAAKIDEAGAHGNKAHELELLQQNPLLQDIAINWGSHTDKDVEEVMPNYMAFDGSYVTVPTRRRAEPSQMALGASGGAPAAPDAQRSTTVFTRKELQPKTQSEQSHTPD